MSPYTSVAATVPVRQRDVYASVSSPQLQPVVQFESARWLASALSDLRSLETTGKHIPGIGDLRVSHATADRVRLLLTAISGASLPEPTLAPFSGGGVAVTCSIGNRELMFSAYPDHDNFVVMRTDEDDEPDDDGILTLQQGDRLASVITRFLQNPAR